MTRFTPARVVSRFLVYVAMALAFLAVVGALGVLMIRTEIPVPPFNWIEFVGTTPIVFWLVMKQFRRYWHRTSFWLAATGLLAAHVGFFSIVLIKYPEWPGIWFVPVFIVEAGLLFLALNKLVAG